MIKSIFSLKSVASAFILIAVAGCASPQFSLTKQVQSQINQVDAVLFIPQNNIEVAVQSTNPGNSGLLGALIIGMIDASRQAAAENAASPIMESLRKYDFRAVMLSSSNNVFKKIETIKVIAPTRVESVLSDSSKRISFDKSKADAVLLYDVHYSLRSGNLTLTTNVEIYPKAEALKQFRKKPEDLNPLDEGNAIYRKSFKFTKQAVTAETIRDDLTEGASNIVHQIAADLNHGV